MVVYRSGHTSKSRDHTAGVIGPCRTHTSAGRSARAFGKASKGEPASRTVEPSAISCISVKVLLESVSATTSLDGQLAHPIRDVVWLRMTYVEYAFFA